MAEKKSDSLTTSVRLIPAFTALIGEGYDATERLPEPTIFRSGTTIIEQDETPKWVGLVDSGMLKLTNGGEQGNETILGVRGKGWWVNSTLALLGLPSLYSVTALIDTSISLIKLSEWSGELESNHFLARQLLHSQAQELAMSQKYIIMRERSAESRLRHLEEEGAFSIWNTLDPTRLMSQKEIADLLSISPEHLSRIRKKQRLLARQQKI